MAGAGDGTLEREVGAYAASRSGLLEGVQAFQAWLEDFGEASAEDDLRLYETLEALRHDRLTVAFVAEFSRGKSELINAIFFAGHGRRLLPSQAGRTTMCPTEIFHDAESERPYVRLLPIETRRTDIPVSEYRRDPIHWVTLYLDPADPEGMAETIAEIVRTKHVPLAQARELGLAPQDGSTPETVEIPKWRHALISFPHPLLEQGLAILDTPGLNAIGAEPELTLNALPAAQAVLFVVGADTGVTRSDLEMWNEHVARLARRGDGQGVIVVLNKIDTLWDELRSREEVEAAIERQRQEVAGILGVDVAQVFPVSAQKGLVAKVRGDEALLARSRLRALERHFAEAVLPRKRAILREAVHRGVGDQLDNARSVVGGRLEQARAQLNELRSLSGKNVAVLEDLLKKARAEQATYLRHLQSYQSSKRLLQKQARELLAALSLERIDRRIHAARVEMAKSWTTAGLKRSMRTLFDGLLEAMAEAEARGLETRRLVEAVFRKFHREHGLPPLTPRLLDMGAYGAELRRLHEEAEAFRRSPVTTMTEQSFVIRKFFVSLVAEARNVFFRANEEAEDWLRTALAPLARQLKERKQLMERRLESLRRISESRQTVEARVAELEAQCETLERQLAELARIRKLLDYPGPAELAAGGRGPASSPARGA